MAHSFTYADDTGVVHARQAASPAPVCSSEVVPISLEFCPATISHSRSRPSVLSFGTAAMLPPLLRNHEWRTSGTSAPPPGFRHGTVRTHMYVMGSFVPRR